MTFARPQRTLLQNLGLTSFRVLALALVTATMAVAGYVYYYPRTVEVTDSNSYSPFTAAARLVLRDASSGEVVYEDYSMVRVGENGYTLSYTPDWFELPRDLVADVCFQPGSVKGAANTVGIPYCESTVVEKGRPPYTLSSCDGTFVPWALFEFTREADLPGLCNATGQGMAINAASKPTVAGDKDSATKLENNTYNTNQYVTNAYGDTNITNTSTTDLPECDENEILVWDDNTWNCRDQQAVGIVTTTNALALDRVSGLTSTVNGVVANVAIPTGTLQELLGYDAAGSPVYQSVSSILSVVTTNTLTSAVNSLTSTVNGVAATTPIISNNTLTNLANSLTSSVNGVVSVVPVVTSNTLGLTQAGGLSTAVNGVAANVAIPLGTALQMLAFDAAGNPVYQSVTSILSGNTTNTLAISRAGGSVSTVNGVVSTVAEPTGTIQEFRGFNAVGAPVYQTVAAVLSAATTVSNTSVANTISTTVNGVTGATVPIINSNVLGSAVNTLTSTINGVVATSSIINSNGLSVSAGNLESTVNGVVASTPLTALYSNALGGNLTQAGPITIVGGAGAVLGAGTTIDCPTCITTTSTGLTGDVVAGSGVLLTGTATERLVGSTNLTIGIDPATIAVSTTNSITGNGSTGTPLQLTGDVAAPGNNFFYGTSGAGVKGWQNLAAAVSSATTNTNGLTRLGGLTNTVNGVVATTTIPSATLQDLLGFDAAGNPVYQSVASILGAVTTNTLSSATNTLTSTVNGVVATAPIINTLSNTSLANTLSTTVNGVTGATVPIINSNTNGLTRAGGLVTVVNGVSANTTIPTGTVQEVLGYDTTGNAVYQPVTTLLTGATTNAFTANQATGFTSTVNGVVSAVATPASTISNFLGYDTAGDPVYQSVGSLLSSSTTNTLASAANTLTSTVNGVVATSSLINSNTFIVSRAGGSVSTINGVAATQSEITDTIQEIRGFNAAGAPVYESVSSVLAGATTVSNTSAVNALSTTVNGVTGATVPIINSNVLGSAVNTLTSTINGVVATSSIINSNALTVGAGNLTSTVNGVATSIPLTNLFANANGGDLTSTTTAVSITGGTGAVLGGGATVDVANYVGATGVTPGTAGLVNPAAAGEQNFVYTGAGTWVAPSASAVTSVTPGLGLAGNLPLGPGAITLDIGAGSGITVSANDIAINAPTCVAGEYLSWNGTAFQCIATTNVQTLNRVGGLSSTVNGVTSNVAIPAGTLQEVLGYDTAGNSVYQNVASILTGATTNTLGSAVNTLTSTVNGVVATSSIINSNTFAVSRAGGYVSTVNGVVATQSEPSGTIQEIRGFDAAGAPVYESVSSVLSAATTVSNTSLVNGLSTTVNGVTGATVPIINSSTLGSAVNTLTSTINGVVATTNIINTNTNGLSRLGGLTNTVNGVVATTAIPTGTLQDIIGYDAAGNAVYESVVSIVAGATTNTLSSAVNTLTSTVNGVVATSPIVNSISNTSTTNTLTTTVNGVTGAGVPIINSNTFVTTRATGSTSTVNGVASTQTEPASTVQEIRGFDAAGNPVYESVGAVLTGATTVSNTSAANTISTTVNGVTGATVPIINSNVLGSAVNTLTSTVNGVGTTASIINSNVINWTEAAGLTSTVNGVVSTFATPVGVVANLIGYDAGGAVIKQDINSLASALAWSLTGNAGTDGGINNFLGTTDAQALTFRTNNFEQMRITSGGFVGIGTNAPATELHLSKTTTGGYDIRSDSFGQQGTFIMNRSSGSFAAPTRPASGAILGTMGFGAYDSGSFFDTAYMRAAMDATTGVGDLPTALSFYTTPDGTAAPLERLRITNAGRIGIGTGAAIPAAFFQYANENATGESAIFDRYSNTSSLQFRTANGTLAAPTAVTANQRIMRLAATGYNGTAFVNNRASIEAVATENWAGAANGTALTFSTTPTGSNVLAQRMRIDNDGSVGIGTNTPTNRLHVSGVINPARFEGLQTGAVTDDLVVADATGVLRTISAAALLSASTTNTFTAAQATGFTSTVNGIVANVPTPAGTINNILGYDVSGNPVYQSVASLLTAATTVSNTSAANTLSTTVNGVTGATVPIINSISNTSAVNTLTTTVNGVAGAGVSIINSNTLGSAVNTLTSTVNGVGTTTSIINSNANGLTRLGGLTSTVNGVVATTAIPAGSIQEILGFDAAGNPVYQTIAGVLSGATTNTAAWTRAAGLTSTVNGVAANVTPAAGTIQEILGYDAAGLPVYQTPAAILAAATTNTLGSAVNTLTSTVNGVAATSPIVNSVANTSAANTISTTVNGVVGATVPIINSNTLGSAVNTLTSTVNGVGTTASIINSNVVTWTQAAGLTSTVNGVASTVATPAGTLATILGYDSTGAPVRQALSALTTTANNGLTINPANNVQLGGTLIQDTVVDDAGFNLGLGSATFSGSQLFTLGASNAVAGNAVTTVGFSNVGLGGDTVTSIMGNSLNTANSSVSVITGANSTTDTVINSFLGVRDTSVVTSIVNSNVFAQGGTSSNIQTSFISNFNGTFDTINDSFVSARNTGITGINQSNIFSSDGNLSNIQTSFVSTTSGTLNNVRDSTIFGIKNNFDDIDSSTVIGRDNANNSLTTANGSIIGNSNQITSLAPTNFGIFGSSNNLQVNSSGYILGTGITNNVNDSVQIGTQDSTKTTIDNSGRVTFLGALAPGGNDGSSGEVLVSQGAGNVPVWAAVGSTAVTSVTPGAGIVGTLPLGPGAITLNVGAGNGITVNANDIAINAPTCAANQRLSWNGTAFSCVTTTNTLGSAVNTLTSTVNGVIATSSLINSNTFAISRATGYVSTVNGVAATQTEPAGTIQEIRGFNAAGAPVYQTIAGVLSGATTVSNTSSVNALSTTVNGVTGATVPIINSNTLGYVAGTRTLTSTVNGVAANQVLPLYVGATGIAAGVSGLVNPAAAAQQTFLYQGAGTWISPTALLAGATTNTLGSAVNTLTSTVNGVAATSPIVNTVANTSAANTISTTVNGVAGATVPIINSNTLGSAVNTLTSTVNGVGTTASIINSNAAAWTRAAGLSSTVNGVAANVTPATGTIQEILGYNAAGAPVYQTPAALLSASTTNTLGSAVNTLTSTVNGVIATSSLINSNTFAISRATGYVSTVNGVAATQTEPTGTIQEIRGFNAAGAPVYQTIAGVLSGATTNTLGSAVNTLTSTVNGVVATGSIVNSISNTSAANNLSTTVNGVTGSNVSIVNSISNTSAVNTLSTTVNGVAGATVPIINSNVLGSAVNTLTSTVNGVGTTASIINSNTAAWTRAAGLTNTTNGVTATVTPATGTIQEILGYNAAGAPVYQTPASVLTAATTNTLGSAVNTLTSTVNGVVATGSIVNSNTLGYVAGTRTLTSTVNGVAANQVLPLYVGATGIAAGVSGLVNPAAIGEQGFVYTGAGTWVNPSATSVSSVTPGLGLTGTLPLGPGAITLDIGAGNGITVNANDIAINAPTCAANQRLSWNGTAFSCVTTNFSITDNDANSAGTTTEAVDPSNTVNFGVGTSGTGVAGSGRLTALVSATDTVTYDLRNCAATGQSLIYYTADPDAGGPLTIGWNCQTLNDMSWSVTGNVGTNPATNFVGTTDNQSLAFRTNNTEWMRLTTDGALGLRTSTPNTTPGFSSNALEFWDSNGAHSDFTQRVAGGGWGAYNILAQNGTLAAPTAVNNNQNLGEYSWGGYDGAAFHAAASSLVQADGAVSPGSMPGRILWSTTPVGSTTLAERMRLTSAGLLGVGTVLPTAMLDVAGSARIRTLPAGAVTDSLVSVDASGNLRTLALGTGLSLGGLSFATSPNQTFATGTTGADFNIVSSGSTHTFNIPSASATNRGLVTIGAQTFAGDKTFTGSTLFSNPLTTITSGVANSAGLRFTNLTSASPAGAAGTKVLTVDASGNVVLVTDNTVGTTPISSLTAAIATNSIDNLNFNQNWNWNSATAQTGLSLAASSLTTGGVLSVSSTNAAHTGSALTVSDSGTAATALAVASGATTGNGMTITAASLTTGNALRIAGPTDASTASDTMFRVRSDSTQGYNKPQVVIGSGDTNNPDTLARDQLYVFGRINTSWNQQWADCLSGAATTNALTNGLQVADAVLTSSTNNTGTITYPNATGVSGICRLTTPATVSYQMTFGSNTVNATEPVLNPVMEARVFSPTSTTQRGLIGFSNRVQNTAMSTDATAVATAATNFGTSGVFFRKNAADASWSAVTANGGTATTTAAVATTNAWHRFRIEIDSVRVPGTPEARFYVDGTLVATHTTNLPTSATKLGYGVSNNTTTAAAKTMDVDYMRVWSDDPPETNNGVTPVADEQDQVPPATEEPEVVADGDSTEPNTDATDNSDPLTPPVTPVVTSIEGSTDSLETQLLVLNTNDQIFLTQFTDLLNSVALQQTSITELLATLTTLQLDVTALSNRLTAVEDRLSQDISGSAEIQEGDQKVEVKFETPYAEKPVVILTPQSFVEGKYAVDDVTKDGFTIRLSVEQDDDVTFYWRSSLAGAAPAVSSSGSSEAPSDQEPTDEGANDEETPETTTPPADDSATPPTNDPSADSTPETPNDPPSNDTGGTTTDTPTDDTGSDTVIPTGL
jgi:hypothetical protein